MRATFINSLRAYATDATPCALGEPAEITPRHLAVAA